jgi:predicted AAA+ superfamily ATPase
VIKRLVDQGHLSQVLLVTTGSNAFDLRRGSEKLPGRKGSLKRTEYIFLPVSYKEFLYQTRGDVGEFPSYEFWGYVLSGGSPLAINKLGYEDGVDDNFHDLIKDWVIGDIVGSGRSRIFLTNLIRKLYDHGASTVSYTKLARDAGLANNSAALDYIEKLTDLCCLLPCMQWDQAKDVFLARKPSKIHFLNLAFAFAFHPNKPTYIHEIKQLEGRNKAMIYEWIVAQELWRRYNLENQKNNLSYGTVENFGYWSSKNHEIDFVTPDRKFYEVKAGSASALDFSWFSKTFPNKKLNVICDSHFETKTVFGRSLQAFLLEAESELYYDEDKYQFKAEEF